MIRVKAYLLIDSNTAGMVREIEPLYLFDSLADAKQVKARLHKDSSQIQEVEVHPWNKRFINADPDGVKVYQYQGEMLEGMKVIRQE